MVSKNQTKLIISLHQKKYRNKYGLFIAEGLKVVEELLHSEFQLSQIYCTDENIFKEKSENRHLITETTLKKISALSSPNKVVALFEIPTPKKVDPTQLILALDDIRDPGNLGTIIRLCDWYGIKDLICSNNTVDCYNTKVVQATMGSLARVNITYTNIQDFIEVNNITSFAATMNGDTIYKSELPATGVIIMGNESNGVSPEIEDSVNHQITIPRFGDFQKTESLNVASATAIILSEFRRRHIS